MSFTFNTHTIKNIVFNGQPVNTLIVDNTQISMFDDSIFDNASFTQAQIVEILNSVNDAGISLSDYRNKLIGKNVTLNNSQDTRTYLSGQWTIADINHQDKYSDSTYYIPNSIDLIATNSVVYNREFSSASPYNKWSTSSIRTWLNDTFKNGFDTEIQTVMSPMVVESYSPGTTYESGGITVTANNITTDYIKLLSDTELNLSTFSANMSRREGTPYSDIFTRGAYNSSNTSRVKAYYVSSDAKSWWTRSMRCYDTTYAYIVSTDGNCSNYINGSYSQGVVPALRLKAVTRTEFDTTILTKNTVTFDEVLSVIEQNNYIYRSLMVGKLVTGLTNSLYSGSYRIIGYDHDGSSNTFDLLTENCVQLSSNGFGSSNRHYNDSGCYARIFAEETFYNAFNATIKEHIKPMEVKYYYNTATDSTGTLQTNTRYGKLLSYNEIGYGESGPSKYSYAPSDLEGNSYPYFNDTTSSLCIKKYNGSAVAWWLRSRSIGSGSTLAVGIIDSYGNASHRNYIGTGCYLAPVIRIG